MDLVDFAFEYSNAEVRLTRSGFSRWDGFSVRGCLQHYGSQQRKGWEDQKSDPAAHTPQVNSNRESRRW
nr:hypothetical protein CFP56_71247 [Quercus suber]